MGSAQVKPYPMGEQLPNQSKENSECAVGTSEYAFVVPVKDRRIKEYPKEIGIRCKQQ